jgi:hypothetical protein
LLTLDEGHFGPASEHLSAHHKLHFHNLRHGILSTAEI